MLAKLKALDDATLRQLNSAICDELRTRLARTQMAAARRFGYGELIQFYTRSGKLVTGRVERFNTKSISGMQVDAKTGRSTLGTWRAAPSMCTAYSIPVPRAPEGEGAGTF